MIHVITKIERPKRDAIANFRHLGAATVHEASGRKGAVDPAIKPIAKGVRLCGPASTVRCHPGDNLMLHKALERAQPGDVLVATVGGCYDGGYWGGLMGTSGQARRLGAWLSTDASAALPSSSRWDFRSSAGGSLYREPRRVFSA